MKEIKLISSYLLIIYTFSGVSAQQYCPGNYPHKGDCPKYEHCPEGQVCLALTSVFSAAYRKCCELKPFCTETGLFSFEGLHYFGGTFYYNWLWSDYPGRNPEEIDKWYEKEVQLNNRKAFARCPEPRSYHMQHFGKLACPKAFEPNAWPLKQCKASSECKKNEFCGNVYNPSFCNRDDDEDPYNNGCLDKSGHNGTSLLFCFHLDDIYDEDFVHLNLKKKTLGLPLCDTHLDCQLQFPDERFFCHFGTKKYIADGVYMQPRDREYKGFCAEANVCTWKSHLDVRGTIGLNGTQCTRFDTSMCPFQKSDCVGKQLSDRGQSQVIQFCCEVEAPPQMTTTTAEPVEEEEDEVMTPAPVKPEDPEEAQRRRFYIMGLAAGVFLVFLFTYIACLFLFLCRKKNRRSSGSTTTLASQVSTVATKY